MFVFSDVSTHVKVIELRWTAWHYNAGDTGGAKFQKAHAMLDFDDIFIHGGFYTFYSGPGREYYCITFTCSGDVDHYCFIRPFNSHLLVLSEFVSQTSQRRNLCEIWSRKKSRTKVSVPAQWRAKRAGNVWSTRRKRYGEYESYKRMKEDLKRLSIKMPCLSAPASRPTIQWKIPLNKWRSKHKL